MKEIVQLSVLSRRDLRVLSKGAVLSVSLNVFCPSFSAFSSIMLQTWRITPTQNLQLETDASTLDEITRRLPEGYYSTFRTFDGGTRVLGFTAHLRRLYDPVSAPEVDELFLRRQLSALLDVYRPGEARVRAVMTKQGEVYLALTALKPLPREIYEKGVHVETTELQRKHPRLKSTTFIGRSDLERKHIAREGIFEALLVKDGKILEGMTSNFFYVIRAERNEWRSGATNEIEARASTAGRQALPFAQREVILGTARSGILLGVTRETVIKIARRRGLKLKYQPLNLDQVETVSETFITSSSRGIVPVVQIDQVMIGQGSPGSITKELEDSYESYVIEKAEKIWSQSI
jgi:branched-chain amino acid aminotransferase